jgi:hypothetical protein
MRLLGRFLDPANAATPNDDLVERGQNTYREGLASIIEPSHVGEFVAVEPDSGLYFLGSTASAALVAAHAAMPNNIFYLTRVGRDAAHTLGQHASRCLTAKVIHEITRNRSLVSDV